MWTALGYVFLALVFAVLAGTFAFAGITADAVSTCEDDCGIFADYAVPGFVVCSLATVVLVVLALYWGVRGDPEAPHDE